ncbi:phosphoribosylamine--glycine ligase [Prochlorococcus sp. MIT 1307]|uniref:phosphoribosylamine--glycine ligase n=1 Tax=Prochlorococcus sp. MIT 1307 TaxID=3096219 RepID=UPI002A74C4B9|nr:phosphoribosylamine--glycine ligase [Prochlorococcus sp. MIT 1307]
MKISNSSSPILPPLKKILVLGSGGRENALAWAMRKCKSIEEVWVAPGNGGTENHQGCKRLNIQENDVKAIINKCQASKLDLVVIGPEAPLAEGVADELREAGLTVFGPGANGAKLEASKTWAKELMLEAGVPTARYWSVSTEEEALVTLKNFQGPLVVKADGLAAGKGVTVAETIEEAKTAIQEAFNGKYGASGEKLVLEERLQGPEVSVFALCDGQRMVLLPPAQDHKRLKEGDQGPNTGGMGAYAPAPLLNEEDLNNVKELVLEPTLKALRERGIDYRGVIYAGLMITNAGPKVIEYNCRFGDPECQTLIPLLGPELANILHACALGCLEQAPKLFISNLCSACVVAATSGYPEAPRYGDLININIQLNQSLQLFHAGTRSNDKNDVFTSGGRVLSVVAQAPSFDEAFKKAYAGLDDIHFNGINFRRDIGNQVRKF